VQLFIYLLLFFSDKRTEQTLGWISTFNGWKTRNQARMCSFG